MEEDSDAQISRENKRVAMTQRAKTEYGDHSRATRVSSIMLDPVSAPEHPHLSPLITPAKLPVGLSQFNQDFLPVE